MGEGKLVHAIVLSRSAPFDRGQVELEVACGLCDTKFMARLWSMHGSGKRCPTCGRLNVMPRRLGKAVRAEQPVPADGVLSRYDPQRHNPKGLFRGGR